MGSSRDIVAGLGADRAEPRSRTERRRLASAGGRRHERESRKRVAPPPPLRVSSPISVRRSGKAASDLIALRDPIAPFDSRRPGHVRRGLRKQTVEDEQLLGHPGRPRPPCARPRGHARSTRTARESPILDGVDNRFLDRAALGCQVSSEPSATGDRTVQRGRREGDRSRGVARGSSRTLSSARSSAACM